MVVNLIVGLVVSFIPWTILAITINPEPHKKGSARVEYNGAILACDKPVHDFGTLWVGPMLSHEFEIRNDGMNEGWFRVGYAFSGSMAPCVVRIEPGETVYVSGWLKKSVDSRQLWGHFETAVTLRVVPDPSEICMRCLSQYNSPQHDTTCKSERFDRRDTSYCIRRPFENACEAQTRECGD